MIFHIHKGTDRTFSYATSGLNPLKADITPIIYVTLSALSNCGAVVMPRPKTDTVFKWLDGRTNLPVNITFNCHYQSVLNTAWFWQCLPANLCGHLTISVKTTATVSRHGFQPHHGRTETTQCGPTPRRPQICHIQVLL